jgi:hypothetical protein
MKSKLLQKMRSSGLNHSHDAVGGQQENIEESSLNILPRRVLSRKPTQMRRPQQLLNIRRR